jgi:cytochrome c
MQWGQTLFSVSECSWKLITVHDGKKGLTPYLLICITILWMSALPSGATADTLSIGRTANAADIERWDIDVGPDGVGLPAGSGTPRQGEKIYLEKCAGCHGRNGQKGRDKLVGPPGDKRKKTIGNYWPYATTVFDYIRRAMPPAAPGSLTDDELYALTAHLLHLNSIIATDDEMNAETLPRIIMPALDRFVPDDRQGGTEVR